MSNYPVELVALYYEYRGAVDRALTTEFGPRRYIALEGSDVNAIIVACTQLRVPAILLEFNEVVPDGARDQNAARVARAVSSVL